MKIYLIPVAPHFQPQTQAWRYPGHNDDYDLEQDFLVYLARHPELLTESADEADWAYLPIFWTRWHMSHDYAARGLDELRAEVARALAGMPRAFTVAMYDDGPVVDVGETVIFTPTRKSERGIDIPTLTASHKTMDGVQKRYRASFAGRLHTHPFRGAMANALADRQDVLIKDGDFGEQAFVETLLASYLALCPRGYSSSFRFYEAMQLGVAPLMISDWDIRPFKRLIDWDACSLYASSLDRVEEAVDRYDEATLLEMGQQAKSVYDEHLGYQRWCPHALTELEQQHAS